MINDFLMVLMTQHLAEQTHFYKDILGLELIFDKQDTVGLGRHKKLFIVLRTDKAEDSHHQTEQKGPQIMTFKCQGSLDEYTEKISRSGFKVRNQLVLAEHPLQYLFIEDFDGNEICLEFILN